MEIFVLITFFVVTSIIYSTIKLGIGPTPTSNKVSKKIIEILPIKTGIVYELGSGWGQLAYKIAKVSPDLNVIGIEASFFPYVFSRFFYSKNNLLFKKENFFNSDFQDADLVICYYYHGGMRALENTLETMLNDETFVITHTFTLPNYFPEKIFYANDLYKTPIYLYKINPK